jgi:hypothetical protein
MYILTSRQFFTRSAVVREKVQTSALGIRKLDKDEFKTAESTYRIK